MDRHILENWIEEALRDLGGIGTILAVNKHIWRHHQQEIEASGDFFFNWQYDVRWAAQNLSKAGKLTRRRGRKGLWEWTE